MPNSPDDLSHCIYYAIGDVHGEADRLARLHDAILEHHAFFHSGLSQVIVHLGDYVDRGPDSCAVIEQIMSLESVADADEALTLVNLRGNHEQQMLDALNDPDGSAMRTWKRRLIGGKATLESYEKRGDIGMDKLDAHKAWLRDLPVIWKPEGVPLIFVHAGIDAEIYPNEDSRTYLWTRSPDFFDLGTWNNPSACRPDHRTRSHTDGATRARDTYIWQLSAHQCGYRRGLRWATELRRYQPKR